MSAAAETLCQHCGLCCDGTLFDRTPLEPADQLRLGVEEAFLPQPCPRLLGTRCGCYAERPATCRAYRCLLLVALEGGEVSLPAAMATVDAIKRTPLPARASHPDLTFHFGRRGTR